MAREPTQPLSEDARQLIEERLNAMGMKKAELARRAGVDKSLLTRVLSGGQRNISSRGLREIASVLGLPATMVVDQYELELEITEELIEAARDAVTQELVRLRASVGRIRATRLTAVVGVEFHGNFAEKQVYERIFVVPTPRVRAFDEA